MAMALGTTAVMGYCMTDEELARSPEDGGPLVPVDAAERRRMNCVIDELGGAQEFMMTLSRMAQEAGGKLDQAHQTCAAQLQPEGG